MNEFKRKDFKLIKEPSTVRVIYKVPSPKFEVNLNLIR